MAAELQLIIFENTLNPKLCFFKYNFFTQRHGDAEVLVSLQKISASPRLCVKKLSSIAACRNESMCLKSKLVF